MTSEANPWANDLLGRHKIAEFIYSVATNSDLVAGDDNALIFSIDGEWGAGKTHFIQCWMKELEAKGHPVMRFDAWENDLSEDPFISLMSEFKNSISKWSDNLQINTIAKKEIVEQSTSIIKSAASAFIPSIKQIIKHQLVKHAGEEIFNIADSTNNSLEEVSTNNDEASLTKESLDILEKEFNKQLETHKLRKNSIENLKTNLTELSKSLAKVDYPSELPVKLPIFIFIDELDRCRPSYAIKLLETLKHILNADGYCFVVATDQAQLCESIKSVYGSGFDSRMYLKRFFNFDFTLPEPDRLLYIKQLSKNKPLKGSVFLDLYQIENNEVLYSKVDVEYCLYKITDHFNLSLRSLRQIYYRFKILNISFNSKNSIYRLHSIFIIWCLCLAHKDYNDFIRFKNNENSTYFELSKSIKFGNYPSRDNQLILDLHTIISKYLKLAKSSVLDITSHQISWDYPIYNDSYSNTSPKFEDYFDLANLALNFKE